MKKSILLFGLAVMLGSCSEEKINEEVESHEAKKEEVEIQSCNYLLAEESVHVNWTAFKHTAKKGVGGTFDEVAFSGFQESESIAGALTGVSFEIQTSSINSGDKPRDGKLVGSFFGTLNTPSITGTIKQIEGEIEGTGVVELTMNDLQKEAVFNWKIDKNGEFFLKTILNLPDWNGQMALDALQKVCSEKHTGEDGISLLWPDVEVIVLANLSKDC